MEHKLTKIAGAIAFIIGAMAIFAGGRVFIGIMPDYYVINWLPLYNYTIGLFSAFGTAVVIWKNSKLAFPAAIATFGLHAIVMLLIQTAYADVVAPDSTRAMAVRLIVWTIILSLMLGQKRKTVNI